LHSYAVESVLPDNAMLNRLHQLYPETSEARVVHEQTLRHHDCPLFAPGTYAHRPTVVTPQPGLLLAGDGVRIDLPVALMERAATTGWTAANEILQRCGLAGHELSTVPTRGRSTLLRYLAGRERLSR
jgi:isorenieratene synthase